MWTKLIVLMAMVTGVGKMVQTGARVVQNTKVHVVRAELSTIYEMLQLEFLENDSVDVHQEKFAAFLKGNIKASAFTPKRDVTKDLWGKPYVLQEYKSHLYLRSAGPDKKWNTADDLLIMVK